MVTISEEQEAIQELNRPLLQRRFGSQVTRQSQQQQLQRQAQARETLERLRIERQSQQQEDRSKVLNALLARRAQKGSFGANISNVTNEERQLLESIARRQDRELQRIAESAQASQAVISVQQEVAQSLTPEIRKAIFDAAKSAAEKGEKTFTVPDIPGLIRSARSTPTNLEVILAQSIQGQELKVDDRPKIIQQIIKNVEAKRKGQDQLAQFGLGAVKGAADVTGSVAVLTKRFASSPLENSQRIATAPIRFGVATGEFVRSGGLRRDINPKINELSQKLTTKVREEPGFTFGQVAGNILATEAISRPLISTFNFATKPVRGFVEITEPRPKTQLFSKAEIANLIRDEAVDSRARFIQIGVTKPQRSLLVPKFELVTNVLSPVRIARPSVKSIAKRVSKGSLSLEDAQLLFKGSKIVTKRDPSLSFSFLPTSKINNGGIDNLIFSATTSGGKTRSRVSRFIGKSGASIRTNSKSLDPISKRLLSSLVDTSQKSFRRSRTANDLTFIVESKGKISNTRGLPRQVKTGSVDVTDIIDLGSSGKPIRRRLRQNFQNEKLKLTLDASSIISKPGKRKSLAELLIAQKKLSSIKFPEREFGLVGKETFLERIPVLDTSLPRRTKFKGMSTITGTTEVFNIKLPSLAKTEFGGKISSKRLKSIAKRNQQQLSIARAAGAIVQNKPISKARALTSRVTTRSNVNQLPLIVGGRGGVLSASRFQGTGAFERQEISTQNLSVLEAKSLSRSIIVTPTRNKFISISRESNKLKSRLLEKNILRETPQLLNRNIQREVTKQGQRNLARTLLRTTQRTTNRPPTRIRLTGTIRPFNQGRRLPLFGKQRSESNILLGNRGFKTFVKSRGKIRLLPGINPKGLALLRGSDIARSKLVATFGIIPTKTLIKKKDINFIPSPKIFRSNRIVKGRKIPLENVFIQRRGKRLSSRSEVLAIQSSRRSKGINLI